MRQCFSQHGAYVKSPELAKLFYIREASDNPQQKASSLLKIWVEVFNFTLKELRDILSSAPYLETFQGIEHLLTADSITLEAQTCSAVVQEGHSPSHGEYKDHALTAQGVKRRERPFYTEKTYLIANPLEDEVSSVAQTSAMVLSLFNPLKTVDAYETPL